MSNHDAICAYCGQCSPKLNGDHVVPRAMWGECSLPGNVVKVPVCPSCHDKWDLQATYFRNSLIAMMDKDSHPIANRVLEGKVVSSLERNPKTLAAFFRNARMLSRTSPGGLHFRDLAFELDLERFHVIPEKIVRGLFYHQWRVPLSNLHAVRVFPGNDFWSDEGFQSLLATMGACDNFGDDVFRAFCTRDVSDPHCTAWLLLFYQQQAFFAWTEPLSEPGAPNETA